MNKIYPALLLVFVSASILASGVIEKNGVKYVSDKLLIKFKQNDFTPDAAVTLNKSTQSKFDQFGVTKISTKFSAEGINKESINNIYELSLSSPMDPGYVASKLSSLPGIEWAEPIFVYELTFIPNDPSYTQQYALAKIQAEQAWDISKGNPDVIIAIVDTGIDWDHPDLAANIWINGAEANGSAGIDDDNNGFIDDIRGWDFGGLDGTPDNNPAEDRPDHGSHVAGIASAITDNSIGVASIGYNCKLMAVKVSQDDFRSALGQNLIRTDVGFMGVVYAVDNGAKVINMSWGGAGFSRSNQELINYVIANGALPVSSSGNANSSDLFYPGAYSGVLSVGYTNSDDQKDPSSNYGTWVDIFAPGSGILSTWQDDTYIEISGSSMSAPLVSGIAGLVFSRFPDYTALQVAEQIRVNADDISSQNPGFQYLLGTGRANAFKALTNTGSKSVRTQNIKFIDMGDGDGVFESNEQIGLEIDFINHLSPVSNLNVRLVTDNSYVDIVNPSINLGSRNTLEEFNNSNNLITFNTNPATPFNSEVSFRLEYSDGSYSDFEWIGDIIINPLYKTSRANDVAVTITSRGTIGFNDYPNNLQGEGFSFENGPNILFEGGLIYGNSGDRIVSSVRTEDQNNQSDEFEMVQPYLIAAPGTIADEQGLSIFNDERAGSKRYDIETKLYTYIFAEDESRDFVILKYVFNNFSDNTYNDFYAGLYFDWDIDESRAGDNLAEYDNAGKFGYAHFTRESEFSTQAAVVLVSEGSDGYYAIDNAGDSGFSVYDGFTDSEKWIAISNGVSKTQAGPSDISTVSSAGPFSIPANGSIEVAFALAAGNSLEELREAAERSRSKYQFILTDVEEELILPKNFSLDQNYPNPFNPSTKISYQLPVTSDVQLRIYDILGNEIYTLVNKNQNAGSYEVIFNAASAGRQISSGVYFYTLKTPGFLQTRKMILVK